MKNPIDLVACVGASPGFIILWFLFESSNLNPVRKMAIGQRQGVMRSSFANCERYGHRALREESHERAAFGLKASRHTRH